MLEKTKGLCCVYGFCLLPTLRLKKEFKRRGHLFKTKFPNGPLRAANKTAKIPILIELTFEQMAQAEKFPANMVGLNHEEQSEKEASLCL